MPAEMLSMAFPQRLIASDPASRTAHSSRVMDREERATCSARPRSAGGSTTTIPGLVPTTIRRHPLRRCEARSLVRISSRELNHTLVAVLQGTKLVVDTTGTSPTILGDPVYNCKYPNQEIREQLIAECLAGPPNDKGKCLRDVNEQYPNIKECSFQRPPVHSYIDFGGIAENYGAVDVPFDSIATIHRDTFGPGGITVDINYVRTTITAGSLFAYFSPELSDRARPRACR